jgi:hypothetical protein
MDEAASGDFDGGGRRELGSGTGVGERGWISRKA